MPCIRRFTRLVVVVILSVLTRPAVCPADNVTVRVIEPDKAAGPSKTDQPAPAQPANGATSRPADRNAPAWNRGDVHRISGDVQIDIALAALKLSEDQLANIKAALEPMGQKAAESIKAHQEELREVFTKMHARSAELRAQGGSTTDDPEMKKLQEQIGSLSQNFTTQAAQQREKTLADLVGVLSAEQISGVRQGLEEQTPGTKAFQRKAARDMASMYVQGITLTEQQQDRLTEVFDAQNKAAAKKYEESSAKWKPFLDRYMKDPKDPAVQKEFSQYMEQAGAQMRAAQKETQKAVEELLTPEQRTQLAEIRQKQVERWTKTMLDWATRSLEKADPTDEQRKKMAAMVDAAREAMTKMDLGDWQGRSELSNQLNKDLANLLTEEQRAKLRWGPPAK